MTERKRSNTGLIITLVLFALIVVAVIAGASAAGSGASAQGLAAVKQSVTRAVVECYALEGAYPPSIEYIEQNYGINLNRDKYFVYYNYLGQNIMPTISIYAREG